MYFRICSQNGSKSHRKSRNMHQSLQFRDTDSSRDNKFVIAGRDTDWSRDTDVSRVFRLLYALFCTHYMQQFEMNQTVSYYISKFQNYGAINCAWNSSNIAQFLWRRKTSHFFTVHCWCTIKRFRFIVHGFLVSYSKLCRWSFSS